MPSDAYAYAIMYNNNVWCVFICIVNRSTLADGMHHLKLLLFSISLAVCLQSFLLFFCITTTKNSQAFRAFIIFMWSTVENSVPFVPLSPFLYCFFYRLYDLKWACDSLLFGFFVSGFCRFETRITISVHQNWYAMKLYCDFLLFFISQYNNKQQYKCTWIPNTEKLNPINTNWLIPKFS